MRDANLEIKIEAHEQTAVPLVEIIHQRSLARAHIGIFLVPGQTGAAEHDGIPAVAHGEGIDVAEIGGHRGSGAR